MSDGSDLLPFDGEWGRAPERKFRETIVFVHHFGGSPQNLLRHVKMANDLGYDTVRFPLAYNSFLPAKGFPITGDLKFGARHVWAGQVEAMLNAIPERKIVYSFSMPSNGAMEAIAKRRAKDVAAWVCDGGPFLQIFKCSGNLLRHQYGVENTFLYAIYTAFAYFIFGHGIDEETPKLLAQFPDGFPVLSIRGAKDPLVPESAIDDVFKSAARLEVQELVIPAGQHLDGLKNSSEIYRPVVEKFLKSHSTSI